jgi:hypothetical protein
MRGTSRRAWLIAGCAPGELLAVSLIIGILIATALTYFARTTALTAQVEVLNLGVQAREYWIETWANDGIRPASETPPYIDDDQGKFFSASAVPTFDGTATFVTTGDRRLPVGDEITLRPAFPTGNDSYAIGWVCGHAAAAPGFKVRGVNHTTFASADLIASCRGRI